MKVRIRLERKNNRPGRKWKALAGLLVLVLAISFAVWAQQPVAQGPQASNAAAWLVSVSTWAGGTLGAMANYGTSPGAVLVPGVNAFVTNASSIGTPVPSTSSTYAFTLYHNASAAAGSIKASAGNLYGISLGNDGTIPCYMQLFNTAGTPTAGTSVIDSYLVQAGTTRTIGPGVLALENFSTGIGYAGATADSGATTTGCTTTFNITAYYQ
jgi:hypothetical protein